MSGQGIKVEGSGDKPWIQQDSGTSPDHTKGGHCGTTLVIAALKVVGYGLGTIGPGIGLGLCGYGLCVGSARQPELAGRLFTNALIFGALAEALSLIGLVAAFIF